MKAIVLGAAGQLGSDLASLLDGVVALSREQLSVAAAAAVREVVELKRPDVVFNCAAYNAVDRAETEQQAAFAVNSEGAHNVAAACQAAGVRLVHFSTNFVFDGRLDRPYLESDPIGPLSAYARSKADGEARVLAENPTALVIRSAALFGGRGSRAKGGSFPERILKQARDRQTISVVSDQSVNPTYTLDLARASIQLATSQLTGIVHVVAQGCCGWDELAQAVLADCGVEWPVKAVTSNWFPTAAARPLNGCLASTRVAPLRPWQDGLRDWALRRSEP